MSNEKPPPSETSSSLKVDALIVWDDPGPIAIVPVSPRCKSLFLRWGMPEECDGIEPPVVALHFLESVPNNWNIGLTEPQKEIYHIAEIPLPQPKVAVH